MMAGDLKVIIGVHVVKRCPTQPQLQQMSSAAVRALLKAVDDTEALGLITHILSKNSRDESRARCWRCRFKPLVRADHPIRQSSQGAHMCSLLLGEAKRFAVPVRRLQRPG
jgi:hypothetical protein